MNCDRGTGVTDKQALASVDSYRNADASDRPQLHSHRPRLRFCDHGYPPVVVYLGLFGDLGAGNHRSTGAVA